MNWLDRENPQAGGAELHFFEIFRRLAEWGHTVTLVTSGFAGAAAARTTIDGIEVRRYGGRQTFALVGRRAIRQALRDTWFDVVVEDINKLPLFTPTLTRLPIYVIVPHLFGLTAFREASWPVAAAVSLAELPIPLVYRHAAFHAISDSTGADLERRGIPGDRIRVIYPGVDAAWYTPGAAAGREAVPTFLYVGRLKRYKGVATALRALALLGARGQPARLDIVGEGDDRPRLEALASRLQLGNGVGFLGFVPEKEKRHRLRRAWAVVLPSAKEGWGISNVEAAACGTPALASDRPGLRESVRHGETGLLVAHDNPQALADAMARLAGDPALVARMGSAARRFAEGFSWDHAARQTETHLEETVNAARWKRKE